MMIIPALTMIAVLFQATPAPAPPATVVTPESGTAGVGEVTPKPLSVWAGKPSTRRVFVNDPEAAQAEPQKPAPPTDDGKMRCRRTDNSFVCGDSEDGMRQVEDMLDSMFPQ